MLKLTYVVLLTFGFPPLHAEDTNVALGSPCCASTEYSEGYSCEKAVDGKTNTDYASVSEGVGMWYKLDLDRLYLVTRLRIMDRYNFSEKNKDLRLTFSDGSFQVITFSQSIRGNIRWTDFPITPVSTYSVIIEVITVYTSGNNGFVEVEVLADTAVMPIVQVEDCPYNIVGASSTHQETWALLRQNKHCMLSCAKTKECVAALLQIGGGNCIHYHMECTADKKEYGIGYIMWRPKRQ